MKIIFNIAILGIVFACLFISATAQKTLSKEELLPKISKLSQSKKAEDKRQAFELSKDYLQRFGTEKDDNTKKVRDFYNNSRIFYLTDNLDSGKYAEGFALGKEILAENPEDSYITMTLAYGGYDALNKKQDKTYIDDSTNYAKQTLKLFEAGKLPKQYSPFKTQTDATAVMYFVLGNFENTKDKKAAVQYFYKATQYESDVKINSYYSIALYYEDAYQNAAKDYQTKTAGKDTKDTEIQAAEEKLTKLVDRMLDAYARTVKLSENTTNPNKDVYKQRFTQIYTFNFKNENGMTEYLNGILAKPMPDPSTL